jgi:hypothetical protein
LDEFVGYLTGEKPQPGPNAFGRAVYTKSSCWAYENEWRILEKKKDPGDESTFLYRPFDPQELAAVYLGCRILPQDRERIKAILATWEAPVELFQMKDERIRFELTAEKISNA